jgi:hypothetical protein
MYAMVVIANVVIVSLPIFVSHAVTPNCLFFGAKCDFRHPCVRFVPDHFANHGSFFTEYLQSAIMANHNEIKDTLQSVLLSFIYFHAHAQKLITCPEKHCNTSVYIGKKSHNGDSPVRRRGRTLIVLRELGRLESLSQRKIQNGWLKSMIYLC